MGHIALATAVSGIASTLLEDGVTLHSLCRVPLVLQETSTCSIPSNSERAELLRLAKLLVIDEVTMGHRYMFEAIDRTLRDLRQCEDPFGGLTIMFCGDWKQILPVVPSGGRHAIVDSILKSSTLWQHVQVLRLQQNMRVQRASGSIDFCNFLLDVGSRSTERSCHGVFMMNIPMSYSAAAPHNTLYRFCKKVYSEITSNLGASTYIDYLAGRAIICPTNNAVDQVNDIVIGLLESDRDQERTYYSHDILRGDSLEVDVPVEYLHSLTPNGFPRHQLHLKQNSCIMLLRNLDPANGHCNGSRYVVTNLREHTIEAQLLSGPHKGKTLLIPRIEVTTSQNCPIEFSRFQFPVRLAYGMTAHKSQGQTFNEVAIYLPTQFFSHGQLYVAMSRVGRAENVSILSEAVTTTTTNANAPQGNFLIKNVVYDEVIDNPRDRFSFIVCKPQENHS